MFDVEVVTVSNRLLLFVNFANSQSFVLIIFLRIFQSVYEVVPAYGRRHLFKSCRVSISISVLSCHFCLVTELLGSDSGRNLQ